MIYQTGWLVQSVHQASYIFCCISFCMWKHFLAGPKHFPPEAECDEHFDGGKNIGPAEGPGGAGFSCDGQKASALGNQLVAFATKIKKREA